MNSNSVYGDPKEVIANRPKIGNTGGPVAETMPGMFLTANVRSRSKQRQEKLKSD
jgi:hypothetical protein